MVPWKNWTRIFLAFPLVCLCELVAAQYCWAQMGPAPLDTTGLLIRWLLFILGVVAIFFLFYKPVYGILLKYYSPSYCKQVVCSMMLLYLLGWISVGAFVLFDYGFMFFWMKWAFVVLAGLWVIWFAVVMLRSDGA